MQDFHEWMLPNIIFKRMRNKFHERRSIVNETIKNSLPLAIHNIDSKALRYLTILTHAPKVIFTYMQIWSVYLPILLIIFIMPVIIYVRNIFLWLQSNRFNIQDEILNRTSQDVEYK